MRLITDPELERMTGEKFVAKLAQTDNHLTTGFIGTPWLLPALTHVGRDDLAYIMLLKDSYPSWGYEIKNGATTLWERWNSIQPAEAGYRTSIIQPRLGGGLTSAEGTLRTVYGSLSSSWQLAPDGRLTLSVTVPVNTTAEVRMPSDSPSQVTESGLSLDSTSGIESITYDHAESMTVVIVGSGTYTFEVDRT